MREELLDLPVARDGLVEPLGGEARLRPREEETWERVVSRAARDRVAVGVRRRAVELRGGLRDHGGREAEVRAAVREGDRARRVRSEQRRDVGDGAGGLVRVEPRLRAPDVLGGRERVEARRRLPGVPEVLLGRDRLACR